MSAFEKNYERLCKRAVEKDIEIHGANAYFSDSKYFKNKDPLVNAKSLVTRILKWTSSKPGYRKRIEETLAMGKTSYDSFEYFFKDELKEAIREKITGQLKRKDHKGSWQPIKSETDILKSRAHQARLCHHFTEIHLSEYENKQTPLLLITPKEWDGKERLVKIFSHFSFKKDKEMDADICFDLFKEWCANIFRRADSSKNQNRILIFRGPQGIGKDYFIENVIGKAFGPYFINIEPQESNKENFISIYGKLLANISEFDQTNRMAVSGIKNLITASTQTLRLPYERAAKDYEFHCSFFASCNFDSILRDTSGNRRFIIFDIEEINKTYDKLIEPEQILAEIYHWYKSDFRAKDESYRILKKSLEEETPENPDDLAFELLFKLIDDKEANLNKAGNTNQVLKYDAIKDDIFKLSRDLGISIFRLQNVIKRRGLQRKSGNSRFYTVSHIKKEE